jgi:hypothetical protein
MEEKAPCYGEDPVNQYGWLFLALSWGGIIGLVVFCFAKIFSKKELK